MTINKEVAVLQHEKLNNWIDKFFTFSQFINTARNEAHEKDILVYTFEIFYWLSKQIQKTEYIEKYKAKINEFFEEGLFIDENKKLEIENVDELHDHINYIKIWFQNTYAIDIDTATAKDFEKKVIAEKKNNEGPKIDNAAAVYNNIFKVQNIDALHEHAENNLEDLIKRTKALEALNKEIYNGKIYIYKTKPLWNPRLKVILSLLLFLGIGISLLLMFIILSKISMQRTVIDDVQKRSFSQLFVISFISSIFFFIMNKNIYKQFKNENQKYVFEKKTFYNHFFFAIFFIATTHLEPSDDWLSFFRDDIMGSQAFTHFKIFLFFVVIVTAAINFFAYFYLNPQKNEKLIAEMLEEKLSKNSKNSSVDSM